MSSLTLDALMKMFETTVEKESEVVLSQQDEFMADLFVPEIHSIWKVREDGMHRFSYNLRQELSPGDIAIVIGTEPYHGGYVMVSFYMKEKMRNDYYCGDDWKRTFEPAT